MCVVGSEVTILQHTEKSADVWPFSKKCSKLVEVPIVDAAIAYDCPFTSKTYILLIHNALHVPSMKHNLIPYFS